MDTGANPMAQSDRPVPRHEFTAVLAWPAAVQISVVLAVTASLFFLIGRLSNGGTSPQEVERSGPALDLNRATKAELRLVPGLGDAFAQRVVDHRERSGGFRSIDDLRQIHGIGPKTFDRIRPHVFVADVPNGVVRIDAGMMTSQSISAAPRIAAGQSKKASLLTSAINVNRADQAELQKLPGIGPKISQRVLDERAKRPFQSIDELRRVPGIGPKTLEKLRPYVTID
jgi:competence protein ComEA